MQCMLVLRGGAVGDMVVTLPALRLLRRGFPEARIELLGDPQRASLALQAGVVDRVTSLERWDLYRLFSQQSTLSEAATAFLSSCELVLSYLPTSDTMLAQNLRRYCPGDVYTWSPHPLAGQHVTDYLCEPVTRLISQPYDACPRLVPDAVAQEAAAHFWQSAGLPEQGVVAFHPGSGGAHKLWPMAGWQEIMGWAARRGIPGLRISGPAEQTPGTEHWLAAEGPPWPCARALPLPHLAALLARCQVVVGHDSGISHLAAAVGTTALTLFGPTNPFVWGPRSPRTCVLWPQPAGPLTLRTLPPAVVIQTLTALLEERFLYRPSGVDCTILDPAVISMT